MDKEREKGILTLFEQFERLKNTPRSGFSYFGVKYPESVAEHTFMVSLITLIIGLILKEKGEKIDLEKALTMAILHEAGEVFLGDLHKMTRKYIGDDIVERAEERAASDLFSLLPESVKSKVENIYHEFNQRKSKEAVLVSSSDKLELLLFSYLLEKWGHAKIDAFFKTSENLNMVKEPLTHRLLEIIIEQREKKQ